MPHFKETKSDYDREKLEERLARYRDHGHALHDEEPRGACSQDRAGDRRLVVSTDEVHLGPSAFLKEQKVEIAKGDAVEVTGSRVKMGESEALLAREIRKGETSWTFRDTNGRPLWMASRRR